MASKDEKGQVQQVVKQADDQTPGEPKNEKPKKEKSSKKQETDDGASK